MKTNTIIVRLIGMGSIAVALAASTLGVGIAFAATNSPVLYQKDSATGHEVPYHMAGHTPPPSGSVLGASTGATVVTTANVNVRATANGKLLGVEKKGVSGTIADGPTVAGAYTWWKITYANGLTGWSASSYVQTN